MKKRKQTKILDDSTQRSIFIHTTVQGKDPSIHPAIRMLFLLNTFFPTACEKTGTVGKFKTLVLIPLFSLD